MAVLPPISTPMVEMPPNPKSATPWLTKEGKANPIWYRYFFQREQELSVPQTTFATLASNPATGQLAIVTDSNTTAWGAVIAGLGVNTVLAWFNGTAWTVIGK